jgi:hypothetical protein
MALKGTSFWQLFTGGVPVAYSPGSSLSTFRVGINSLQNPPQIPLLSPFTYFLDQNDEFE